VGWRYTLLAFWLKTVWDADKNEFDGPDGNDGMNCTAGFC